MTRLFDMTVGQQTELWRIFDAAGITLEEGEAILRQPRLAKYMASNLHFHLNPDVPMPNFTPVANYVERIMTRSAERGWGLGMKHVNELSAQLANLDHDGPLGPVSVRIWLGQTLEYNWVETMAWLNDELMGQGVEPILNIDSVPTFRPGSEITGEASLTAVELDLSPWNAGDCIVPNRILPKLPCWPSLEVLHLLCLNPDRIHAMDDYGDCPFLLVPGLDFDGSVLGFRADGPRGEGFRDILLGLDEQWWTATMPRPREL